MILLREVQDKDLGGLEKLAKIPGFLNLMDDRDFLKGRIRQSIRSFEKKNRELHEDKFTFVAEELETHEIIGTSMISSQHGTPKSPHLYWEVGKEEKFSETINTGFIHGTLELKVDSDGPSEIGGLVVDLNHRNSDSKVGRQISFIRFLFLAMNRERFKDRLLAELLPPLNKKGQSPLWEAVGRRFTNMDYWEADRLCQKNKEFIFSLFPTGKIHTTFFTAEARNAIGKLNRKTEPVFHMLSRIGFKYLNHVDPFDGGPHLWADVDDLLPVKSLKKYSLRTDGVDDSAAETQQGLVCVPEQKQGEFRAVAVEVSIQGGFLKFVDDGVAKQVASVLGFKPGSTLNFMPFY